MPEGIVTKSTGSWYTVKPSPASEEATQCRIIGKLRLNDLPFTNPIAVGDRVVFEPDSDGVGAISEIVPRINYVARQSAQKKHEIHVVAANIDQACLFVTIIEPDLKQGFIDRFLLSTEPFNIPTIICFNKSDIYTPKAFKLYELMHQLYTDIGYTVFLTSNTNAESLTRLREAFKDKITLISGQSGVGKSSVVNAIESHLDLRTGGLSGYSGKGQHTTTFAEMHRLSFGGSIIDTPGLKTFTFNNLEPLDVVHNFREFFALSAQCKFGSNCTHREEPNCAVLKALELGTVSPLRYNNYIKILAEVEEQNKWERHK